MKIPGTVLAITALSAAFIAAPLHAQSTTAADIAEQELELKKKELEVEKAKIEEQKLQKLDVEKAALDVEKQKLELEKAKRDLQVQETAQRLDMQLQGDVLFDTNEATIKPEAKATLEKVATVLAAFPEGKVTVVGHADSRGSDARNLKLSKDRAEAVKIWLQAKSGASEDRIVAIGQGEEDPAASNATSEGRQLNRRVDISVAKL